MTEREFFCLVALILGFLAGVWFGRLTSRINRNH